MIVGRETEPPPRVAVLIGLVSTEDGDRILETLASLDERQGDHRCEVVLVDRKADATSARIRERYPQVQLASCPAETTLPEMRTRALTLSRAPIIAVTEDHCVPCDGWLEQITKAFDADPAVVAVGGSVENGVCDTGFDWATFLCEYSFFSPPVAEGITDVLPGMNVAYRREILVGLDRDRLASGFWETTVHPRLTEGEGRLLSRNAMKMFHCKKFSMRLFFAQRFIYSRYYAGLRFAPEQRVKRATATVASAALPPLLLFRMVRSCLGKGLRRELLQAFPALAALTVVWAAGEMWGYVAGPGHALAQIE